MKAITVKLDDQTARDLEDLARRGFGNQSDIIRQALRRFLAKERLAARRAALERYLRHDEAQRHMAELADSDLDEAASLLAQAERR